MGDVMREIKVGKDGVVPILDTSKLYILDSISVQACIKKALVKSHSRWTALVYEFDNAQEFEKERNVTLYVDVKK